MEVYCRYLRKSRADAEAAPGESLARHRAALIAMETQMGLVVTHEFHEIVSGDSIAARPQMQEMLAAIERGEFAGVTCMDAARLARGNSIDQGVVAETFKSAGARIITPGKVYDPNDEMDEEYFEFSLFMARREYKWITRRMERGKDASAKAGLWLGKSPFGYQKYKLENEKGYSLHIFPEQRDIALMMAYWFCGIGCKRIGGRQIAANLDKMGIRTNSGAKWVTQTVLAYLKSPAPRGLVRRYHPQTRDSKIKKAEILVKGRHEAIYDEQLAKAIDAQFALVMKQSRTKKDLELKTPLAGLLFCAKCGHVMSRALNKCRTQKHYDRYVICRFCKNAGGVYGTKEGVVLEAVLSQIAEWKMQSHQPELLASDNREAKIRPLKNKLQKLSAQRERIYEMLEQGVYTPQVFAERIAALDVQVADVNAQVEALSHHEQTDQEAIAALAPHIDSILSAYEMADTIVEKNQILKSVIARIEYVKEHMTTKKDPPGQYLKITVFPRHNVTSSTL